MILPDQPAPAPGRLPAIERVAVALLLLLAAGLRVPCALWHWVDTDEPQHLHVVWGWAKGLMQYRDVPDNHAPLFHMLMSPLVACLGDRPDLLIWMRLAMMPLFAVCLLCAYWIARRIFSHRVGLWSAVLLGLLPPFFYGTDFRADVLWTALWLLALAVLVGGRMSVRRSLVVGLLLGAAASVSLKTSFLLVGLGLAAIVMALISFRRGRFAAWKEWIRWTAVALGGMLVLPACLVAYFWSRGALDSLFEGVIGFNLAAARHPHVGWTLAALLTMTGCAAASVAILKLSRDNGRRPQAFLVLLAGTLPLALSFWPIITGQDFLPIYPVQAVIVAAAAVELLPRLLKWPRLAMPVAAAVAVVLATFLLARGWRTDQTLENLARWRDVLSLTDGDQTVMDRRGDLIFRRRGVRYVLETLTMDRFDAGTLRDDIPEQLVANRTLVASPEYGGYLPARARAFVFSNYVSVGTLMVVGKFLRRPEDQAAGDAPGAIGFEIALPARYALVTPTGFARGELDGTACSGDRTLGIGRHLYVPDPGETHLAVVWAQAIDRGFRPQWAQTVEHD